MSKRRNTSVIHAAYIAACQLLTLISRAGYHAENTGEVAKSQGLRLKPGFGSTLVFCIPLFYNPGEDGSRAAVEPEKFVQTVWEIRRNFSGYQFWLIHGWYRDGVTGQEFVDDLWRFEIDGSFDVDQLHFFKSWKGELETRFRQQSIYFKFSGPVTCW